MSEYGNEQNGLVYESNPDIVVKPSVLNVYTGNGYDYGRSDAEVLADMAENYLDLAEDSDSEDTRDVIAENEEMAVVEEDAPFKVIDLNNNVISENDAKGDIIRMPEVAFNNLIRHIVDKYENEDYVEESNEYHPLADLIPENYSDMSEEDKQDATVLINDVNKDLADAMDDASHEAGRVIDDNEVEAKVPDFSL